MVGRKRERQNYMLLSLLTRPCARHRVCMHRITYKDSVAFLLVRLWPGVGCRKERMGEMRNESAIEAELLGAYPASV